jgi:hypothetical protein
MANTRSAPRLRRRFRVTLGQTTVFTVDVGPGGFAADIHRALPAGTPVEGTLRLNGADVGYTGQVAWARAGDPHLNLPGRIGVRFRRPPDEVHRVLASSPLGRAG